MRCRIFHDQSKKLYRSLAILSTLHHPHSNVDSTFRATTVPRHTKNPYLYIDMAWAWALSTLICLRAICFVVYLWVAADGCRLMTLYAQVQRTRTRHYFGSVEASNRTLIYFCMLNATNNCIEYLERAIVCIFALTQTHTCDMHARHSTSLLERRQCTCHLLDHFCCVSFLLLLLINLEQ